MSKVGVSREERSDSDLRGNIAPAGNNLSRGLFTAAIARFVRLYLHTRPIRSVDYLYNVFSIGVYTVFHLDTKYPHINYTRPCIWAKLMTDLYSRARKLETVKGVKKRIEVRPVKTSKWRQDAVEVDSHEKSIRAADSTSHTIPWFSVLLAVVSPTRFFRDHSFPRFLFHHPFPSLLPALSQVL